MDSVRECVVVSNVEAMYGVSWLAVRPYSICVVEAMSVVQVTVAVVDPADALTLETAGFVTVPPEVTVKDLVKAVFGLDAASLNAPAGKLSVTEPGTKSPVKEYRYLPPPRSSGALLLITAVPTPEPLRLNSATVSVMDAKSKPPPSEKVTSMYLGISLIRDCATVPPLAGNERAAVGGVVSDGGVEGANVSGLRR